MRDRFGTVWPDGYGINYTAAKDRIQFGIESKKSASNTDTQRMKKHVDGALRKLRQVCEEGAPAPPRERVKAKL